MYENVRITLLKISQNGRKSWSSQQNCSLSDVKSFLPLFLQGPASAVYKQPLDEEKDDCDKMKAALLSNFGVNCYSAYEQPQKKVLHGGETVDIYSADLRRLVTLMKQTFTKPLLKCTFMAGLSSDVAIQLKSMAMVKKQESCCLQEIQILLAQLVIESRDMLV